MTTTMTTTDLTALIERAESLQRVTKKFAEDVASAAKHVASLMEAAGVSELQSGPRLVHRRSNVDRFDELRITEYGGDLTVGKIVAGKQGFYHCGDCTCWVLYPTRDEAVRFAEALPVIYAELAELAESLPEVTPAE